MLDAYRRGYQIGGQIGKYSPCVLPDEDTGRLARFVWVILHSRGWVPLTPRKDFVRGFVEGYQLQVSLASCLQEVA